MRSEIRAYRALLRQCRRADLQPAHLVTLLGRPPRLYSPQLRKVARAPPAAMPFVEDAIWEACGGSTEYAQPRPGRGAAATAVRKHRRRAAALGLSYTNEAEELLQRFAEAAETAEVALRAAHADDDPMELAGIPEAVFDAPCLQHLAADDPEPAAVGDFLITHPLACIFQPSLDRAVIVLDDIDERVGYVHGVVLNMPSPAKLRDLVAAWPQDSGSTDARQTEALSPLLDFALWRGGDLAAAKGPHEDLHWVHSFGKQVPGAREIAPEVWMGGDIGALGRLASDSGDAGSLRPFIGYCGWARKQLALEIERGVWVRVRARTPVAARALCLPPVDASFGEKTVGLGNAQKHADLWKWALRAAGMRSLAEFPRGEAVDSQLQELLNRHFRQRADEISKHSKAVEGS